MKSTAEFVPVTQAGDYPDLMTSPQVCRAAGITYRALDYWVRNNMITPAIAAAGSGSSRLFDPSVVYQITEMKQRIAACPYKH
jgi:MerR HTH family regulatory protein